MALDGQCNDIHLTLSAVSEVDAGIELATPQFRLSETNRSQSSIRVACNINSVARPGLFQRQCLARNTETGAKTSCSYKILVTSKSLDSGTHQIDDGQVKRFNQCSVLMLPCR